MMLTPVSLPSNVLVHEFEISCICTRSRTHIHTCAVCIYLFIYIYHVHGWSIYFDVQNSPASGGRGRSLDSKPLNPSVGRGRSLNSKPQTLLLVRYGAVESQAATKQPFSQRLALHPLALAAALSTRALACGRLPGRASSMRVPSRWDLLDGTRYA